MKSILVVANSDVFFLIKELTECFLRIKIASIAVSEEKRKAAFKNYIRSVKLMKYQ